MTDLRRRIHAGETLIGAFSDLASPLAVELLGRAGMDWVILDLEHGAATEADLLALLYAASGTSMTPLVRAQSAERLRIGRALDLGAAGVMLPQLQSIDAVRDAVAFLRYPPVGSRGVALRTRGADMGRLAHADLARTVNERIIGIVQIEAAQMVRDVDEIAALEPVDVVFVGPADLSHALGIPGSSTTRPISMPCGPWSPPASGMARRPASSSTTAPMLARHLDLGFRFIGLGSEGSYVSAGAAAMLAAVPGR